MLLTFKNCGLNKNQFLSAYKINGTHAPHNDLSFYFVTSWIHMFKIFRIKILDPNFLIKSFHCLKLRTTVIFASEVVVKLHYFAVWKKCPTLFSWVILPAVYCEQPQLSNGVSVHPNQNSYSVGQTITYQCTRGTSLDGAEEAECLSNGQFSEPSPTCTGNKVVYEFCDKNNNIQT